MKRTVVCILAVLVLVSSAAAEQLVDETRPAAAHGVVTVELLAGSVKVIGWAENQIRVTGSLGDDVEELEISVRDDRISIEVELPHDGRRSLNDAGADLEIYVPENSTVELETVSADIQVERLAGAVEVESVSGEVDIQGAMREVEVSTVSGDIMINSDAPLNEAELESVSGDIDDGAETGTVSFDVTETLTNCMISTQGDGTVFTVNTSPPVRMTGDFSFSPTLLTAELNFSGGFAFTTSDGRAGTCAIDISRKSSVTTTEGNEVVSGTVCGQSFASM